MKIKVVIVNVILILFVLSIGELAVRKMRPDLKYVGTFYFEPSDEYNHSTVPTFQGEAIGPEGYRIPLEINSLGLADASEPRIPKPQNVFRVLIVGDSFIQGLGDPDTIPYILQKSLKDKRQKDGKTIEVINCGQSSYSPLLHLARFKNQLYQLQPDSVIYFPDLTDVYDDWFRYRQLATYDKDGNLTKVAASKTYKLHDLYIKYGYESTNLYIVKGLIRKIVALRLRLYPLNSAPSDAADSNAGADESDYIFQHAREEKANLSDNTQQMVKFSVDNIARYVVLIRSYNAHISIAAYPHLPQIISERASTFRNGKGVDRLFNRVYEDQIEALGRREHVPFKSFYEDISTAIHSGERLYFSGDMHFNKKGIERLGNLVAAWVNNSPEESIGTSFSRPGVDLKERLP